MLLEIIFIVIEALIVFFCLLAAIKKKKVYGYCFALTFLVYCFYDIVNYFNLAVNGYVLYFGLIIATFSAFFGAVLMYLWDDIKIIRRRK